MKEERKNIAILIVEDEPFIAQDISDFLEEQGYHVQGVCYDYNSAIQELEVQAPDLCLLDINLGKGKNGLALGEVINSEIKIPFVYLTSYSDTFTLNKAKTTMPYGYITKPIQFKTLLSTIEIALHNFSNRKRHKELTIEQINSKLSSDLTSREFELLKDIYDGKTNNQLAQLHYISLSTVKTHVHRIYEKFDCHTRSELIAQIRQFLTE